MTVKLSGYQKLGFTEGRGTYARELIDQVLFYYEIPSTYARAFAAQRGNHIYEYDEIIPHKHHEEDLIELIPKYIHQLDSDMPITLLYCVISYCFTQFKQNVYNYTENLNLQIIISMKKILEESDTQLQTWINQKRADHNMQTPQSQSISLQLRPVVVSETYPYTYSTTPESQSQDVSWSISTQLTDTPKCALNKTINLKKLFPEKFIAAYDRVQKHISLMELLFFDEFNALDFKYRLFYVHRLFQQSSYYGLYIYPCLDVQIDWVSYVGVSFDGISLLDAELSLGYAFFPFFIIQSIIPDEHHQVFIDIDYQQQRSESKSVDLSSQTEASSFVELKTSVKKQTKSLLVHAVAKIPVAGKNDHEGLGTTILNKQITNTQIQLNDDTNKTDVLMVGIFDTLKQRRQREHIVLRFLNKNQQNNFMQTYKMYSQNHCFIQTRGLKMAQYNQNSTDVTFNNAQVTLLKISRNLHLQSRSRAELFCNAYLNACITFCCIPNNKIEEQLRTLVDLQYFKGKTLHFQEICLENVELMYGDLKAISQSLKLALTYFMNDKLITLRNYQGDKTIEEQTYTNGVGTPYSPFLENGQPFIENLEIKRITLSNNGISEKRQIGQIVEFLHIQQIQDSLENFTFSSNKLNYEHALMLGNAIQKFKNLIELNLSYTDISPVSLCNILYLLDKKQIYIKCLNIAGTKLKTKAQIQQVALYILHAYNHYQHPMTLVDISECLSNQWKAQQFAQVFKSTQKLSVFHHIFTTLGNGALNKQNSEYPLLIEDQQRQNQQYIVIDTLIVKTLDFLTVQELLDICRIIEL